MKKLFTILIISLTVTILSSSIIVTNGEPSTPIYNITLNNNTNYPINDWYVKNADTERKYAKSSEAVSIPRNSESTMYGIPEGNYYIVFTLSDPAIAEDYKFSAKTYINRNTLYYARSSLNYSYRSVLPSSSEGKLVLIDSAGNEIELVKVSE